MLFQERSLGICLQKAQGLVALADCVREVQLIACPPGHGDYLSGLVPSGDVATPEAAAASLTLAGGEVSGRHTAPSPRPPGPEEISCPRDWILPKGPLEQGS